jgi:hypothetical protein
VFNYFFIIKLYSSLGQNDDVCTTADLWIWRRDGTFRHRIGFRGESFKFRNFGE